MDCFDVSPEGARFPLEVLPCLGEAALELGPGEEVERQGYLTCQIGAPGALEIEVVGHAPTREDVVAGPRVPLAERVDPLELASAGGVGGNFGGLGRVAVFGQI